MKTLQETFNRVAKHLLTQNEKAVNSQGNCQYRQEKLKCAIGCLIPDSEYHTYLEDQACTSGSSIGILMEKLGYNIKFLQKLQGIHDYSNPIHWKYKLNSLAYRYNLELSSEGGFSSS